MRHGCRNKLCDVKLPGVPVLYAGFQSYTVEMARNLAAEAGWRPVYWTIVPAIEEDVASSFPGVTTHHFMDAIRGVPPSGCHELPLPSLDSSFLVDMANHEAVALDMMDRNDIVGAFSHRERKRLYHRLLRYWLAVLDRFAPRVVLFEEEPHQAFSFLLYVLGARASIQTVMFVRTPVARLC